MEIFHGGCVDCTMQDKKGIGYCVGCQYFNCDWSLPNLNNKDRKEKKRIDSVRDKARAMTKNILGK